MKQLLIVWFSRTGGAAQMAEAAAEGARTQDDAIDVRLLHATQANGTDVLAADGYLFVTPENLASMAGPMKDFFDRIYYDALDRTHGRPYAILICAGTDGTGAIRQIQRIATGLRLKEVAPALIIKTNAQTPAQILAAKTIEAHDLDRCREIGAALASGLSLGIF
ncbi:MAG TPA: NAD(P)H-dependent oxidoreductase [Burkholderiaceae bacterium]|nr:NAD(P)H-dependent oxidoreductase [Burkholderiaceae bacterium]